ncbi:tRNA (guanosine(37)-N1)-methyltransferase TrmD [Segeticoccus rhizosphaerae]|uniref:tRNA (guanosine(37)-N1)-methyltransferase TrmD n=1 Tax=Segeticoccus rhizosphaerae TaxID=1104777 RepID=UPI001264CA29|nr:tRNA (guanosine(37)-N1)-methyltransferase TrmD [Segeticoccus rhizosphaerae]
MRLDLVTIFPDYLAPLDLSLIGKARRQGLLDVHVHDLRSFTHDRHRTVDETPYGGGPGMVMRPEPWGEALDHLVEQEGPAARPRLLVPGPGGKPFTQAMARELAHEPWLAFACGRYEGIDERVYEYAGQDLGLDVTTVSLGDYVVNGGEVAVLAMVEAIARLVPGVIGNAESLVEESHEDGLLEYPVFTKPPQWHGRSVPDVLLSGDHGAIADWRHQQRLERTAARRPDLLHVSASLGVDGLEVTPAQPSDVGELVTLQRACWLPEAVDTEPGQIPAVTESMDQAARGLREWQTFVVRSGGRLVGSVRGRLAPGDETVWQIARVMVAPDLQGRGLGRALLVFAEGLAPGSVRTLWLTTGAQNTRNQRFYRRAGYRRRAGEPSYPGAVDLTKRRPRPAG